MEGAMPRCTRPCGALGCCQPSFTPQWQAARSISCDAEGPTSATYNSTLDKQPRACAAHRRDARARRVSATAMWALQGPRAPAAPEQGCVSTARKADSVQGNLQAKEKRTVQIILERGALCKKNLSLLFPRNLQRPHF